LSLADGSEIWRAFGGIALNVTGRAALAGGSIHVPTDDGLTTIDAASGDAVGHKPLPGDQLPLGNLLCLASALFSVDTNEVRKFPDLTVSYPRQLARYHDDPTNEQAAVRLAWMELLRDDPKRTVTVLEPVLTRGRARYRTEISRLWIDAKLRIAALPETTDARAVEHLTAALAHAESDFDRLRATLALSSRLRRVGQEDEAYLMLWRLGLTSAGDGYVTVEQKLRNRARMVIAEVLGRFERDLTARQLATIQAATNEVLAEAITAAEQPATAGEGRGRLMQLAELDDAGGAGQAALVALGNHERAQQRFEQSEQYYREAIRRDRAAVVTAEALRDLAEQYAGDGQRLAWEAWQLLDTLERSFPSVTIASDDGTAVAAAQEVERLRQQIDRADAVNGAAHAQSRRFLLRAQPSAQRLPYISAASLFEYVGSPSEAAGRVALLFDAPNQVRAMPPGEDEHVWSTRLRLLGSVGAEAEFEGAEARRVNVREDLHSVAFCDGQTAVINGQDGLFGIGLLSGRRIWGVPYEESSTADRDTLRNRLVAVDRGRLICAPRRGVLTCASMVDGSDVRWERILTDERVDTVFLKDDMCFTLDNLRQRATAYDAANGRRIATLEFRQPPGEAPPVPLVYEHGHLVGPEDEHTVVCYALRTGGENWRLALPQEVRWVFNAGEGYVGVCGAEGHFRLIDILSGDVALSVQLPELRSGYAEGVIRDDMLVLMTAGRTNRGPDPSLVGLDLATGSVRWRRDGFGPTGASQFAHWKRLHTADEVVPMFRRAIVESDNPFQREAGNIELEIIEVRSGETIGPTVSTGHAVTDHERLTGEFGHWPGYLLVGTRRGIMSVPTTGEKPGRGLMPAEDEMHR
jgi:tetratricopeptide (TPR) repeat protein